MNRLEEIRRVEATAELLHSEAEVERAIARLAAEIGEAIADSNPIVMTILTGGIVFAGKLLTHLRFPLELDAIGASRYRGRTRGGETHWRLEPGLHLKDRTVLLVDDILDEGITLAEVRKHCFELGAARVLIAVLVDKNLGREKPCRADFVGLVTENRYLFGYGLDYKGYLRNAAGIYACTGTESQGA
ncbi:hypoxanthine-guanine phosphoribosyltransferase [Methylococcus geothermalis]|uniref:Hypoxanthine-guanine phosphoribosyltransferase n=1 Tax=Methylococcus geothermalis TaxID=2681310 RepID=A0A858Q7A6_9GAMM|nr:hypoxanthine-guanine phosphoribosyltransferase [Methylococcus geothermalis]QJD29782.1 hypoxanthine-guanine phosphoribosyltransferase [Methylococcus geothermalis]